MPANPPRQGGVLSTPSARRATLPFAVDFGHCQISIHALREEGDLDALPVLLPLQISIHALREEGDVQFAVIKSWGKIFLSTPSARRATSNTPVSLPPVQHFYPRPPRGGRPLMPQSR